VIAPPFVRRFIIPVTFALLCAACIHADAHLGTLMWMTASMDLLLFPIVGAITVLALTPGLDHLRTPALRMAALYSRVAAVIARKLGLRLVLELPCR